MTEAKTITRARRGTGSVYRQKGRNLFWIKFYRNGRPIRESSNSDKERVAEKLLLRRLKEVSDNTLIEPRDRKITVDDLFSGLIAEYSFAVQAIGVSITILIFPA